MRHGKAECTVENYSSKGYVMGWSLLVCQHGDFDHSTVYCFHYGICTKLPCFDPCMKWIKIGTRKKWVARSCQRCMKIFEYWSRLWRNHLNNNVELICMYLSFISWIPLWKISKRLKFWKGPHLGDVVFILATLVEININKVIKGWKWEWKFWTVQNWAMITVEMRSRKCQKYTAEEE